MTLSVSLVQVASQQNEASGKNEARHFRYNPSSFSPNKIQLSKNWSSMKHVLTLAEAADVFEYFFAIYMHRDKEFDEDTIATVFLKILEDVIDREIDVNKLEELEIFLKIRIATYSRSIGNLVLDESITRIYEPLVKDLIQRKLETNQDTKLEMEMSPKKNIKNAAIRWKPDRTPHSPLVQENIEDVIHLLQEGDSNIKSEHQINLSKSPFLASPTVPVGDPITSPFLLDSTIQSRYFDL